MTEINNIEEELTILLGLVVYSGQATAISEKISKLIDLKINEALGKKETTTAPEIKNGGNPKVSTVEIKRWR